MLGLLVELPLQAYAALEAQPVDRLVLLWCGVDGVDGGWCVGRAHLSPAHREPCGLGRTALELGHDTGRREWMLFLLQIRQQDQTRWHDVLLWGMKGAGTQLLWFG